LKTTAYHDVGVGTVVFCVGVHVWLTVVLTLGCQIGKVLGFFSVDFNQGLHILKHSSSNN